MSFFDLFSTQNKKQVKKQELINEANSYIEKVKNNKGLIPITTSILLKKDEDAFLATESTLRETKAIRYSQRGGVGLRVAKGVYVGRSSGKSESQQEWRVIDSGDITVTNQKLVFNGEKENRIIPIDKIVSISPWSDAIEITSETKNKSMLFSVDNPFIWAAVVNILVKVDDPKNLDGVNLDIQIK